MSTTQVASGHVHANGADLYYESRGEGPAMLLVGGGLADAGQFTALAERLARRWQVVAYDRRGNSRSPAPAGWNATTVEEQASDAAGLLAALGLHSAAVYGHSIGAAIALRLALGRPEMVTAAVLHDPAMMSLLDDPAGVMAVVGPVIEEGMNAGGPSAAADAFYRFAVGEAIDALDPATYERMKADGAVLFGIEFERLSGWRPSDDELHRNRVPILILAGQESPPFFREAAGWLAGRLHAELQAVPGGHGAPFDHPSDVEGLITGFCERARP